MVDTAEATTAPRSTRGERVGWYFYDFANSAFSTSVVTVFLGPYLGTIAERAQDAKHQVYPLGIPVAAGSLFSYAVSLSVLLTVFVLPIVGAIADRSSHKRELLGLFAYVGEQAQQLPLVRGAVGDGADDRQHEHGQQHRQRHRVGEQRPGRHRDSQRVHLVLGVLRAFGDGTQVRAEEDGDHRGGERGVGEVVEVPADPFHPGGARGGGGLSGVDHVLALPSRGPAAARGVDLTQHVDAIGHDAIHA